MGNTGPVKPLGFEWDRAAVANLAHGIESHSVERVLWRYRQSLAGFVWDAAVLEGNPFTYPEVQTLMEGITVGGHKISDERQVTNLADAARQLHELVNSGNFAFDKATSDALHATVARDEALEAGHFRGEGSVTLTPKVNLGERGSYTPPATEPDGSNLRRLFEEGVAELNELGTPFEQAAGYFLFASMSQFYFDGNKRTARSMMNGQLMSQGVDAISVPATRRVEFNSLMVDFYATREGTAMFGFLVSCHPDRV